MDNAKKSFVLYLDNWPELEWLDMEQRGLVLTVVFDYAAQLASGKGADYFAAIEKYPQLNDGGSMACGFLCATLERDHLKWLHRKQARQRREGTASNSLPAAGTMDSHARADMERARRLLGQMRNE